MRYTTTALVAAALLATTCAYAQSPAGPAPQAMPGGDTTAQQPGKPGAANTSDQDELSRRLVRHIQARLKQQGYYDKTPDGTWDTDTVSALEDFQDSNGLQSTGQLDGATIYILGIATPPYSGSSAMTPGSGASGMGASGMGGGSTAQQASDQPQQQARQSGYDIHQVVAEAYQQGYQQGLMQGFRQAQSVLGTQGGPGQGSSQPSSRQMPSR